MNDTSEVLPRVLKKKIKVFNLTVWHERVVGGIQCHRKTATYTKMDLMSQYF